MGFNANSEQTFSPVNKLYSKNEIVNYNYDNKIILNVPDGFTTFGLNPGGYYFKNSIFITPDITYLFLTNMNIYIFKVSVILHEFLHFMGMVHTHQVAENNPIITWNEKVIEEDFKKGNLKLESIKTNITNKNDPSLEFPQEFDYNSIMNYTISRRWNKENISLKENYKLSELDKKGLTTFYGPASKPDGPDICNQVLPPNYENYNHKDPKERKDLRFIPDFMSEFICKNLKIFTLIIIICLYILSF